MDGRKASAKMNGVYAVVVTYNPDNRLLKKQYDALQNQVEGIVYIDNASSVNELLDEYIKQGAIVIRNKENLGLARAQNQGISALKNHDAKFVILLDQDTVPAPNCIDALVDSYKIASLNEKVAAVGPIIKDSFQNENSVDKGIVINGFFIGSIEVDELTNVDLIISSGAMIPITVLDDIGGMKEGLFIDSIDLEWCLRAKHYGYKIFQTNITWINHRLGNGNSDKVKSHSPEREYYIIRNGIWLSRQSYIPCGYRIRKLFMSFARFFYIILSGRTNYVKPALNGMHDGFRL